MAPYKKNVDWKKIERLYRAGLLSIGEIARECGTVEGNIRHRAKKEGWKRDLTQQVRNLTRTKFVEHLAQKNGGLDELFANEKSMEDEKIIEEAARTQIQVIREHQKAIGHGHRLTMRMLDELDATTAYAGELQKLITENISPKNQEAIRRAVGLNSRATVLRDLATAARTWVTLERQAFNIVDDRDKGDKKADDLNKTAEELRQEIIKDAHQLGLELSNLGIDDASQSTGKVTH